MPRPSRPGRVQGQQHPALRNFFAEALTPRGTQLAREDLDRLDTARPVLLRNANGHKFWLNSRAIGNLGIDERTPVPPGGQIGREARGRPNGFFAEMEVEACGDVAPVPEAAQVELVRAQSPRRPWA